MILFKKAVVAGLLLLILFACNLPATLPATTASPSNTPTFQPPSLTPTPTEALCAFVEGRQQLRELSGQLLEGLKNVSLAVESARAEAYGENCLAADGTLVRFAARETDYYITLVVSNLQDEASLGSLLEKTINVISGFPVGSTPGPNPGYIGVTFNAGDSIQNTWFLRSNAEELLKNGLHGAELYNSLVKRP